MVRLFLMSENSSPVPSHAGPSANPTGPATCSNVQLMSSVPCRSSRQTLQQVSASDEPSSCAIVKRILDTQRFTVRACAAPERDGGLLAGDREGVECQLEPAQQLRIALIVSDNALERLATCLIRRSAAAHRLDDHVGAV